jgi:hypothetical protein
VFVAYLVRGLLARWFDCEASGGEGSEVKLSRAGTRIYTLGRHKADLDVHPRQVAQILRRLEIPREDWLRAVYPDI